MVKGTKVDDGWRTSTPTAKYLLRWLPGCYIDLLITLAGNDTTDKRQPLKVLTVIVIVS